MGFKSLHSAFVDTYYVLNKQNLLRPTKKSIWVTYLHTLPTISIAQTSLIYKYPILLESVQHNFLMKPSSKKKTKHPERNIDNSVYVLLQFSAPAHYLVWSWQAIESTSTSYIPFRDAEGSSTYTQTLNT